MENNRVMIGIFSVSIIFALAMSTSFQFVEAHPHTGTVEIEDHTHQPQTEIIPLNGEIGIEKTILSMYASPDNTLPWGFVEGKIANHVSEYPVIIQIYDDNGEAFHFAQTEVEEDGSYEYKFRVRNVDNGEVINIFEGDYAVNIFKVVYLNSNSGQV